MATLSPDKAIPTEISRPDRSATLTEANAPKNARIQDTRSNEEVADAVGSALNARPTGITKLIELRKAAQQD